MMEVNEIAIRIEIKYDGIIEFGNVMKLHDENGKIFVIYSIYLPFPQFSPLLSTIDSSLLIPLFSPFYIPLLLHLLLFF